MANAMKGVTKAMGNMNKQMKLPEIQKIMMEFEKQSEIMDMKGEMMEDAIGNAFEYNLVLPTQYSVKNFSIFLSP